MVDWREVHLPDVHWAPRGLPGTLKSLPGWVARAASESRFAGEIVEFEKAFLRQRQVVTPVDRQVLVVPGFGFGDPATLPMQVAVKRAGFRVVRSEILANVRCSDRAVDRLAEVARSAVDADHGQRLMVVGHSRGGMLARGLGARHPELVSTVVSLGAPLNDEFAFYEIPAPLVRAIYASHRVRPPLPHPRCLRPDCPCPYMQAVHRPMPREVELVSVYSPSDGIIDWRSCVVPGARNIRVESSHLGMGVDPRVVRVVLTELGRPLPRPV